MKNNSVSDSEIAMTGVNNSLIPNKQALHGSLQLLVFRSTSLRSMDMMTLVISTKIDFPAIVFLIERETIPVRRKTHHICSFHAQLSMLTFTYACKDDGGIC